MSSKVYRKTCRWCSQEYTCSRSDAKFCSPACRQRSARAVPARQAYFDRVAKGLAPHDIWYAALIAGVPLPAPAAYNQL